MLGNSNLINGTELDCIRSCHIQLLTSSNIHKLSPKDVILSSYSVLLPFGLGVYLAALYNQCQIEFTSQADPTSLAKALQDSKANLLFLSSTQSKALADHLSKDFQKNSSFYTRGSIWSSKLTALRNGQISRSHPIWDSSFSPLSQLRAQNNLTNLRAVLTFTSSPQEALTQSQVDVLRVLIGVPVISGTLHCMAPTPLTATIMHDYQALSPKHEKMHVGPPVNNVQIKLSLDKEEGDEMIGELLVDGPGTARLSGKGLQDYGNSFASDGGWLKTGWKAEIRPNGTVRLL